MLNSQKLKQLWKLEAIVKLCRLLFAFCLLEEIIKPVTSSRQHSILFEHPRLYPESFDWDPRQGHFLLGSITTGGIVSVSDAGVCEEFISDGEYAGMAVTLGLKVDSSRNRVLVVVHSLEASAAAFNGLAAYDLASKNRIFLSRLSGHGVAGIDRAGVNDLCIDHAGNAYVTDTFGNFIWKVDSEGTASVFSTNPIFLSQPLVVKEGLGLNGIAYCRGGFLLVGQSNSGLLFKVNLDDAGVRVVQLSSLLPAVDGISLRGDGLLVAVSTHTAWLLSSKDSWLSARVIDELPLNSSANITAVAFRQGRHPYVLHSYFQEVIEGRADRNVFAIEEVQFPSDKDHPIWLIMVICLFLIVVFAWRFQLNSFFGQYTKKRD